MEIKTIIATLVALVFDDDGAYVDEVKTFVFIGELTKADIAMVMDEFVGLVEECTDQLSQEDIYDILLAGKGNTNKDIAWRDGSVSLRWEEEI